VVASASLGGVTANAAAVTTTFVTATSSFGSWVAEANTIPIPPTPPTPESSGSSGFGMPNFVQPYFPPVVEVEQQITKVTATALAKMPSLKANAISRISFSILADDEEVLFLI
jgi:hypothetical protein